MVRRGSPVRVRHWTLVSVGRGYQWLRERPALVVLLVGAALLRVAVAVAYRPALFHQDSWAYLVSAVELDPLIDRPYGYPVLLAPFVAVEPFLLAITSVQHLAGLVAGGLVYWTLESHMIPRWIALAGAAVTLLDGYAIALEQYLMPETFFALAVLAGLVLVSRTEGTVGLLLSGLLIGGAATIRTVGIFVLPCWFLYVVLTRRAWRPVVAGTGALAVPLIALAMANSIGLNTFSLNPANGWFLYGRIGEIAQCGEVELEPDEAGLCSKPAPGEPHRGAQFYVWERDSPANIRFGPMSFDNVSESSKILGGFARHVIRQRPGEYAEMVAGDFARYFDPRSPDELAHEYYAPHLPAEPRTGWEYLPEKRRASLVPDYQPRNHFPDDAVRSYVDTIHTSRLLMGVLALLSLIAAALIGRKGPLQGPRRDILLFSGAGLAMLFGSAATSEFIIRYLVPCVPLFAVSGMLSLASLRSPSTESAPRAST
jgi:4-amino-4-deoxy-L-arabinose transferase-like glycosyltransferase